MTTSPEVAEPKPRRPRAPLAGRPRRGPAPPCPSKGEAARSLEDRLERRDVGEERGDRSRRQPSASLLLVVTGPLRCEAAPPATGRRRAAAGRCTVAAIGPVTAEALRKEGLGPHVVPERATAADLVAALVRALGGPGAGGST